jgi:ketosteroid isomerase-like protein
VDRARLRAVTRGGANAAEPVYAPEYAAVSLRQAEAERLDAIKHGDLARLQRIYAPEYTAVFSLNPGHVMSKVQELALQGPEARQLLSWEPDDVTIRIYGHVGLVTGRARVRDILRGQRRHIHSQYTHVWVRRDGGWQIVHRHVDRLVDAGWTTSPQ